MTFASFMGGLVLLLILLYSGAPIAKQRKMVLKELPRVRAGYGATFASRLRSSR